MYLLGNISNQNIYSKCNCEGYVMVYLKVESATFRPIKMFKKQSLSFHVVSKTFITQNYLFVIPSNILRFSCLYRSFLAHFKPIEASTILKNNIIAGIILMRYTNALTWTRSYWKYIILIIKPCKESRVNE